MNIKQKPGWLKKRLPTDAQYEKTRNLLKTGCINTVCIEAKCPNQWECFSAHTATFLIMGSECTRNCAFCAVDHNKKPAPPDKREPDRIVRAAYDMGLDYIVITSVTRDDLPDGGAFCFADTIQAIEKFMPNAKTEILIPDFGGNKEALKKVINAKPDVLNHNIETVKRLYPSVRPHALYNRSLRIFENVKKQSPNIPTKSGIMLGFGETDKEIKQTLTDIFNAGCNIITIGQYLQPSKAHFKVKEFILPEKFEYWKQEAYLIGFSECVSGPFVRSSYYAKKVYEKVKNKG
ncbi:MAG: lipoyl synthase [Deltaproteobacteria bacterium]|nr:lipoyl synthase [Deltaproteobacteria bacterium]